MTVKRLRRSPGLSRAVKDCQTGTCEAERGEENAMGTGTIFLIVILGLVAYIIAMYNRLVRHKNLVEEGWSGIETQLKRRANLVPNLIETVKGYAGHEKDTLEDVVRLRNQAASVTDIGERGAAEGMLTQALGKLFALAEALP